MSDWLGVLEAVGWFVGFALLIDWFVSYIFPVAGVNRRALAGATIKLIASVLFLLQPFIGLVNPKYGFPGALLTMPNLVP